MKMVRAWPKESRTVANDFIKKYGLPDEATPSLLMWHDNGPWKRTIVYKEPIEHNFPIAHKDVVEQVINFEVPADKADELATFDGSVYFDRTRGELSAKCDKEVANMLALNLAVDVITDKKSPDEARQAYADAMQQVMSGAKPEIVSELKFERPSARAAADPDRPLINRPITGRLDESVPRKSGEPQP